MDMLEALNSCEGPIWEGVILDHPDYAPEATAAADGSNEGNLVVCRNGDTYRYDPLSKMWRAIT